MLSKRLALWLGSLVLGSQLWVAQGLGQTARVFDFTGPLHRKQIGNVSWPAPWHYQRAALGGKVELEILPDPDLHNTKVAHMRAHRSSFLIYLDLRSESLVLAPKQKLTWSWKAPTLPTGGSALDDRKNDQVLQLYLAFPKKGGYNILGYVWDNEQPQPSANFIARQYTVPLYGQIDLVTIVVRRGASEKWVEETRNVTEDYHEHFEGPAPTLHAIGIWCDSDHTRSYSEGYIGPLKLH